MKKFMTPLAMLVASFATDTALGLQDQSSTVNTQIDSRSTVPARERFSVVENGDEFNFVLKRDAETGQMMAWHESHASHSSHSSHRSHYSSR